ncbi:MAG TPA: DUF3300 domain-containing protein [Candidatus Sulfotelmatobacter sp.]|nr:DUF3300 domain-containing protein [Candidatus Sulfotelmatobacter sp.]
MQLQVFHSGLFNRVSRNVVALICAVVLTPGDVSLLTPTLTMAQDQAEAKIPADQLDSLVAPIALYPDQLMSQVLVASTYPLEVVQLQQWLEKNKNLKDKALADAAKKQDWDASIQALALLPDAAKYLAENIKWTTDLGNAFLAQQNDVMDAVQRMRKKAQDNGNLKSTEQQKVETKVVENKQVIVVQQASPEVVYVPSYNPTVVYGAPPYPYPPIAYPPPGYYAAGMAISFGIGIAMGAAWGGGWGWNAGWGGNNNVTINNNNNFVNNSNRNVNRNSNVSNRSGNTWQHNPQHRGGAPYGNRSTADRFGGSTRGDSLSNRQANARRDQGQRGDRQGGVGDRTSGNRPQQAAGRDRVDSGGRQAGGGDRSAGNRNAGGGSANRGGGGDRVGDRSVSSGGGSRNSSAFGGGGGSSGGSARSSSARGSSSMSGGGSRGGSRSGGGGGGRRR